MAAPPPPPPFLGAPNLMIPPPLPPGWTEHPAPGGQPYFYNVATRESTYVRPLPAFPVLPFSAGPVQAQAERKKDKKDKKERPKHKTRIPGTPWLRVTTTAGNVFFTHSERKESVWTVPEEIKDEVARLEREEKEKEGAEERKKWDEEDERRKAVEMEVEWIKREVESTGKRKATEEPEPLQEVVVTKKARVEEEEEDAAADLPTQARTSCVPIAGHIAESFFSASAVDTNHVSLPPCQPSLPPSAEHRRAPPV